MKKYTTVERVNLTSGLLELDDDQARRRKRQTEPVEGEKNIYKILQTVQFKSGETFGYEGGEINRGLSRKFEGDPWAPKKPENPDGPLLTDIIKAIATLDPDKGAQWTTNGAPQVKALQEALGQDISAGDRDAAWQLYQEHDEIVEAIVQLDPENAEQWTDDKKPDVKAIQIVMERDITEGNRDLAWALYQEIYN